nr:MAG TPA: hypothetical protein [Caudoviricetes sp.]
MTKKPIVSQTLLFPERGNWRGYRLLSTALQMH